MTIRNYSVSPVQVPIDGSQNEEGPLGGMNGGATNSCIGIASNAPNPKVSDWGRTNWSDWFSDGINWPIGWDYYGPEEPDLMLSYSVVYEPIVGAGGTVSAGTRQSVLWSAATQGGDTGGLINSSNGARNLTDTRIETGDWVWSLSTGL
jgi:hypothetical protein